MSLRSRLPRIALAAAGAALVVALGAALYANSFSVPFLFDDEESIIKNVDIRTLRPWTEYLFQSRGVLMLTVALNFHWGELRTWGYHLVNVAVHVTNGLLVFALAWRTLTLEHFAGRYRRRAPWMALIVALVFTAHPLATMAVTYIIQRAESLAALFSLLALLLFVAGARTARPVPRAAAYGATAAAAHLGMATKETAVAIPFVLLLYDLCFLGRGRAALSRRWPLYLLLLAVVAGPVARSWYLLRPVVESGASLLPPPGIAPVALSPEEEKIVAGLRLSADRPASAGFAVSEVTPLRYFMTELGVIAWYLRLYLLPDRLCFDYGWPFVDSFRRLDVLAPLALLGAIGLAAAACFRRTPLVTFCIGWFFLALAPSSSFLPILDAANDYRMYPAVAPLTLLVVAAASALLATIRARLPLGAATAVGLVLAVGWIAWLGRLTVARNEAYRDRVSLSRDSLAKSPNNWRPYYDLGTAQMEAKQFDAAEESFKNAIRLNPKVHGPSRIHLGETYAHRGMMDKAIEALLTAAESPDRSAVAAAYRGIGILTQSRRQWDEAAKYYRLASRLMPEWSLVRKNLATLYAQQRRWQEATREIEAALAIDPAQAPLFRSLAATIFHNQAVDLLSTGERTQSCGLLEKAVGYNPQLEPAYSFLALCYAERERWAEAESALQTAVRLSSSNPRAVSNLERVRRRELPDLAGVAPR